VGEHTPSREANDCSTGIGSDADEPTGEGMSAQGWFFAEPTRTTTNEAPSESLNAFARSGEGKLRGEPHRQPARTEPRPPGITQGDLEDRWPIDRPEKPIATVVLSGSTSSTKATPRGNEASRRGVGVRSDGPGQRPRRRGRIAGGGQEPVASLQPRTCRRTAGPAITRSRNPAGTSVSTRPPDPAPLVATGMVGRPERGHSWITLTAGQAGECSSRGLALKASGPRTIVESPSAPGRLAPDPDRPLGACCGSGSRPETG
jgi:hypothetical protein